MKHALTFLTALAIVATVAVLVTFASPALAGMAPANRAGGDQAQPLSLALHLQKGDTHQIISSTQESWHHASIQPADPVIEELTMTMETLDIDEEGNITAKITYDRYTFRKGPVSFDSDDPNGKPDIFLAAKSAMVGQSFKAKLSPRNEVLEIMDTDMLRQAILAKVGSKDAAIDGTRALSVMGLLRDEDTKEHLEYFLPPYSDKPLNVGDTWVQQEELSGSVSDCTYTLESRQDGIATLRVKGDVTEGNTQLGTMKEVFNIDEASGTIVEAVLWTETTSESTSISMNDRHEETRREIVPFVHGTTTKLTWRKLTKE
ncbi:MAG: hypothetical protein JW889_07885 [Verrucomicrobia bacterium]|nr:hypothetical protein [Verrucomicrobiota bacterium]